MNAARFWPEVLAAAALATAGALLFHSLAALIGTASAARACVLLLAAAYLGWILYRRGVRIGRLVTVLAWSLASMGLIVLGPPLWIWLLVQGLAIWLLRSVASYERLGYALLDAALGLIAVGAAIATARHSGSLGLALWSYFLVQALSAAIPSHPAVSRAARSPDDAPFESALHSAEAALRRLSRSAFPR